MSKTRSKVKLKPSGRPLSGVIEDLQAELAARRLVVEQLEETHAERIRQGEEAIAEARRQVDDYVAKIAESLGLPNPAAREAKRQETLRLRKQVQALARRGKEISEIAAELGVESEVVAPIYAKIADKMRASGSRGRDGAGDSGGEDGSQLRLPPEAGQKGWKRERVRVLHWEGKTRGEIAKALDISKECVGAHITALRVQGRLEPAGSSTTLGDPPSSGSEDSQDDGADDGDSVQDLREEVTRQQGSSRTKAARLQAAEHDEHAHVAAVDRMGDGVTVPDESGHQHKIYRFVLGGARSEGQDVHRHGLLAKEPGAD